MEDDWLNEEWVVNTDGLGRHSILTRDTNKPVMTMPTGENARGLAVHISAAHNAVVRAAQKALGRGPTPEEPERTDDGDGQPTGLGADQG